MAGFFSRLFGSSSDATCHFVGYWCETTIKFSNKIETPLGSKVSVLKVCVDIRYSVRVDDIVVEHVQLSKSGGSLGDQVFNVATTRGEAFYASSVCNEEFLKQAVRNDLEDRNPRLRDMMLAKWRGEHGPEASKTD